MLPRFRVGDAGEVVVLATVQGLVSERDRVRDAVRKTSPALLALGVPPESVEMLSTYERPEGDPFEDLSDHDFIFAVKLREFGDVDLPPPDVMEALRLARDDRLEVVGVDLPEDEYGELFTKTVSAWGFLRFGRIQKRLARKPPKAKDARSFALAWDAAIRKVKGIAKVEETREALIAQKVAALARERGARVLLVLDVARAAGVERHLAEAAAAAAPGRG